MTAPMTAPLWTRDALAAAAGAAIRGPVANVFGGVSIDTRTLMPGDLFVPLSGDHRDGHDFVAAAIDKGAGAALVSIERAFGMPEDWPLLVVDDPFESLRRIGRAGRARLNARIVAVTGSVGKTGTKEALRHVLGAQGVVHASVASYNNHWGVPLTLARTPQESRFAVYEIGMSAAGEIRPLVDMVRPQVAIVTTVEPVHLEFFPSVAAIADAKAEIFTGLERGGTAIINSDNPHAARLRAHAMSGPVGRVVTFGASEGADVRLMAFAGDAEGSDLTVSLYGRTLRLRVGSPGRHIAMNMLAVLAAVDALGGDVDRAAADLVSLVPPQGRGAAQVLAMAGGDAVLIDESYNANPASMRAALANLGLSTVANGGRRIAVLGDMRELGVDGPRYHAELAGPVSDARVDLVFCCGPLMAELASVLPPGALGGYASTSEGLESLVVAAVRPGDVVMVKGSLGSRMGPIVAALKARFSSPVTPS